MKTDSNIEFWAHMLDEAFDKRSDNEKKAAEADMPADENTKFKIGEVFTDDIVDSEDIEKVFDKIWPNWYGYFTDKVEKHPMLKIEGERKDVDDWDVWEISLKDCYHGIDSMVDLMFDDLFGRWPDNKETTLKEIIDTEFERLLEKAQAGEACDLEHLEQHGYCIHKGCMHYGGYYPG